jgi:flagellar biosynthetic protein FliP
MTDRLRFWLRLALLAGLFLPVAALYAQTAIDPASPAPSTAIAPIDPIVAPSMDVPGISIRLGSDEDGGVDVGIAIQLLLLMTLLSVGPGLIMMMTSFLRIIIVLGFLRSAMGLQTTPPNQMLVAMAAFLTFFLMMPIGKQIYDEAILPLQAKEITTETAMALAAEPLKAFMLKQTRPSDIEFFLEISKSEPVAVEELPLRIVVPSFMLSELRTAFQMGFLIFLPFLVVDFVVATVLMSMGMMMMPPVIVSLPFKILLFVLVDGWFLVIQSLVASF